jgi:methionyl-tRNA formyltransferase
MTVNQDINVICNSNLAIPALHELIRCGRLCSIAMPNLSDDSRFYIEGMCSQLSIPFKQLSKEDLKSQIEWWLSEFPCKAVVCMAFPYKIPVSVLTIPELGFINVHFALLPNYRGATPVFWQIKNREPYGGITVHQMDEHWDTGKILFTRKLPIHPDETHGMHWGKLALEGALVVPRLLKLIDPGKPLLGEIQARGRYYPKPTYNDVKLDWQNANSTELLATIKACNPWNKGAFTFLNGKELRIVEASVNDVFHEIPCGAPGSILVAPDRASFAICCKDYKYLKPEIISTDEGFITSLSMLKMGINENNQFH